jgi:adenylate cyclase
MPPDIDFGAEGLLDGLDGGEREERVELLQTLLEQGYALEDLKRVPNVALLPAESAVGGPPRYTARDVEEKTGMPAEFAVRLRHAGGLPIAGVDDPVFIESDIEIARTTAGLMAGGITEEQMIDVTRVLGRGLAPAADEMRRMALGLSFDAGTSEAELAERYGGVAGVLSPLAQQLVSHLLMLHLRFSVSNELANMTERREGRLPGARPVAVAFADLVGFTRLGEMVAPDEVGRVAERLEALSSEVAKAPVRIVKTIGDAVMLACPETEPLLSATIELVGAADEQGEEFPQLRAGVASGEALHRAGDWFGRPVNLASRVTSIARPGSVLATQSVRDELEDAFRWSFAGERKLKGIGEVPVHRARALEPEVSPQSR